MGKESAIDALVRTSDLKGKTVIVTGANTGIGKEAALQLAKTGARIILACRNPDRANQAREDIVSETKNENVVVKILDLSSLQSVKDFARDVNANEARLDILVNNAGVWPTERKLTQDGFELMFGTNHLGHFLLTNLLLDKLKKSAPSRIVNVASVAHEGSPIKMDDLQSEKKFSVSGAYGRSKSANILFTVQLAAKLDGTGVTANSLHPGFVKSELYQDAPKCCQNACVWCCLDCLWRCFACEGIKNPEEGAHTTIHCCLEPSLADTSGLYFNNCKVKKAKAHATDLNTAEQLWKESLKLVGLKE